MAWYYGTYICGHEGRVNIIGPEKDREWKKEREFSKMCPDCYKVYLQKQREEEARRAMELAKEMELPPLKGTEKQVAWAEKIRQNLITWFDKLTERDIEYFPREHEGYKEIHKLTLDDIKVVKHFILEKRTSATYFIDNRYDDIYSFIAREYKEALKTDEEKAEEDLLLEIKKESTVFPDERNTNAVVEITVLTNRVTAKFEKNEEFRKVVKSLGYTWEGSAWEKKISETTGSAEDRAAELGNKLLNAGFPICIFDEEIRRKAIEGDFEPECHRWIFRRKNTKKFAIKWEGWNDTLYKRAKSLPGARWDSGSILVDVAHYEVVTEFAELYGFKFTETAQKLIEQYKKETNGVEVVSPIKVEEKFEKDGLKEILESEATILDDLKD
ncbi:hypothetical protein P9850_01935 [Anoxybacillus rupiensis]|uniref:Large polyvalent protein associated domain-containing protein n=1 Tax=Anoxybacteroides rupiense TaxID=311460 RepID=A0ABD5IQR9_9BACL|nr:hypothetical protein [Anoxybacillus rupiensis]